MNEEYFQYGSVLTLPKYKYNSIGMSKTATERYGIESKTLLGACSLKPEIIYLGHQFMNGYRWKTSIPKTMINFDGEVTSLNLQYCDKEWIAEHLT